jgi:hypothetical protein
MTSSAICADVNFPWAISGMLTGSVGPLYQSLCLLKNLRFSSEVWCYFPNPLFTLQFYRESSCSVSNCFQICIGWMRQPGEDLEGGGGRPLDRGHQTGRPQRLGRHQCCGSMTFWCGSGSGSADPCL